MFITSFFVASADTGMPNSEINISIGEKLKLTTVVSIPDTEQNIKAFKVKWEVANKSIVKVDTGNNLVGLKEGSTTIVAKVQGNEFISTSFIVNVTNMVTKVTLDKTTLELKMGQSNISLTPTIYPQNAKNQKINWKSSNEKVVYVNKKGQLIAVKNGTAVITATSVDGGHTASCTVTVVPMVTGLNIMENTLALNVGEKQFLKLNILPLTAYDRTINYIYSNKGIVKISKFGEVTALKEGSTTVYLQTNDGGFKGTITIAVNSNINTAYIVNSESDTVGGLVYESSISLKVGEVFKGKAVSNLVDINSLENYKIKWSSSNKAIATVNSKGEIKGVANGVATITAEVTQDSSKVKAHLQVRVNSTTTGVALNKYKLNLFVGQSEKLIETVLPNEAFLKTVKWTSSNAKVAKVYKGKITGVSAGTAVITVTSVDGSYKKQCTVTVTSMTDGILVPNREVALYLGDTYSVTPQVVPSTALVKTLKYSVSNKNGLSVKQSKDTYFITATKEGIYNITFESKDGKKTTTITFIVTKRNLDLSVLDSNGNTIVNNKK